jgi:hypothetical protein
MTNDDISRHVEARRLNDEKSSQPSTKNTSTRKEKLIEGVLRGKTPAKAARDAGYSESYSRVDVYKILAKASTQERIAARVHQA